MSTPAEYAAVQAAIQRWVGANAGFYASMIPTGDIATVAKIAVDTLDAYRAKLANTKGD
jgi:hypothetical protein